MVGRGRTLDGGQIASVNQDAGIVVQLGVYGDGWQVGGRRRHFQCGGLGSVGGRGVGQNANAVGLDQPIRALRPDQVDMHPARQVFRPGPRVRRSAG